VSYKDVNHLRNANNLAGRIPNAVRIRATWFFEFQFYLRLLKHFGCICRLQPPHRAGRFEILWLEGYQNETPLGLEYSRDLIKSPRSARLGVYMYNERKMGGGRNRYGKREGPDQLKWRPAVQPSHQRWADPGSRKT